MATVDMDVVQFYQPSSYPPFRYQTHNPTSHPPYQECLATSSLTQAPSIPKKLDCAPDSPGQRESGLSTPANESKSVISQAETNRNDFDRSQAIINSGHGLSDSVSNSDYLPTIVDLLRAPLSTVSTTIRPFSEHPLQCPENSALHDQAWSSLAGQGSDDRGLPIVIEDDDSAPTETEHEAKATSLDGDKAERTPSPHETLSTQDFTTELTRPVDSSAHVLRYDAEARCYIDEALSPSSKGQEGSAAFTRAQNSSRSSWSSHGSSPHQINEYNDEFVRSTIDEPIDYTPTLQEEAVKATRDNHSEPDQQAEKVQPQSTARETRCAPLAMNEREDDDEEPRPKKRRRSSVESRAFLENSPLENSNAQSQTKHGHLPTLPDDDHPSKKSRRSSSPAADPVFMAKYQEWAFTGFLKRTTVGDEMTYTLEFKLPPVLEHVDLREHSEVLGSPCKTLRKIVRSRQAGACSLLPIASPQPLKRVLWTNQEDTTVVEMKKKGCSWDEICAAVPGRTKQTIQVRYSTKLKGQD